jgi:hypothetical protein
VRHVARTAEIKFIRNLAGNLEGKRTLGRLIFKLEDDIKMNLKEI